jgi:hypothetical protein
MGKRQPRGNDERGWLFLMPVEIYKDKKKTTMKDFDDWLSECPVPYEQTNVVEFKPKEPWAVGYKKWKEESND